MSCFTKASSTLRPSFTRALGQTRFKTSRASPSSLWLSRTHLKQGSVVPPPIPPIYPTRVILSDGSSFTSFTTAPTPSTVKLTRDVNNNPLWAPASERTGLGESEDGRMGKFRKRFEGLGGDVGGSVESEETQAGAFALEDLDWMSEGVEEKITEKQRNPIKSKSKGKKK